MSEIMMTDLPTEDLERQAAAIAAEIQRRRAETEPQQRRIVLRKKDLNSKGNGCQKTRRVLLPGGTSGWASDHGQDIEGSWESGSYLASQRRCSETGLVPVGTIVLSYESRLRGGEKQGRADVEAGIVVSVEEGRQVRSDRGETDGKSDCIRWGLSTRRRGQVVEVQTPTGEWMEV